MYIAAVCIRRNTASRGDIYVWFAWGQERERERGNSTDTGDTEILNELDCCQRKCTHTRGSIRLLIYTAAGSSSSSLHTSSPFVALRVCRFFSETEREADAAGAIYLLEKQRQRRQHMDVWYLGAFHVLR